MSQQYLLSRIRNQNYYKQKKTDTQRINQNGIYKSFKGSVSHKEEAEEGNTICIKYYMAIKYYMP